MVDPTTTATLTAGGLQFQIPNTVSTIFVLLLCSVLFGVFLYFLFRFLYKVLVYYWEKIRPERKKENEIKEDSNKELEAISNIEKTLNGISENFSNKYALKSDLEAIRKKVDDIREKVYEIRGKLNIK